MEHSKWSGSDLTCGTGSEVSCRDLARHAQLWLNKGSLPDAGQIVDERFMEEGTTYVQPPSPRLPRPLLLDHLCVRVCVCAT
jgi:hypothetical protein